jgi:mRNA interferase YafQ
VAKATGQDLDRLVAIVDLLLRGEALPARCRSPGLSGEWNRLWECHIEPDWLLIWNCAEDALILVRTGPIPICSDNRSRGRLAATPRF